MNTPLIVDPASFNELGKAMAAAQSEMKNPGYDSTNPHFRNKFASLASVRNAVVPVLAKHGISVMQTLSTHDGAIGCTTMLLHTSGQSLTFGPLLLPASKADAQGYGSAATYARRYSLMAVCGVVGDDDDDANAAIGKPAAADPYHRSDAAGDLSRVPQGMATDLAQRMAKALDEDVEEDIKALKVYDIHMNVRNEHDLYIAAAELLPAKSRSAWKAYCKQAEKVGNQVLR
jgi:hypothetical protein